MLNFPQIRMNSGLKILLAVLIIAPAFFIAAEAQKAADLDDLTEILENGSGVEDKGGSRPFEGRVDSFIVTGVPTRSLTVHRDLAGSMYLLYPASKSSVLLKLSDGLRKIWGQKLPIRGRIFENGEAGQIAVSQDETVFAALEVKRANSANCLFLKYSKSGQFVWSREFAGCKNPRVDTHKNNLIALVESTGEPKGRNKVWTSVDYPENTAVLLALNTHGRVAVSSAVAPDSAIRDVSIRPDKSGLAVVTSDGSQFLKCFDGAGRNIGSIPVKHGEVLKLFGLGGDIVAWGDNSHGDHSIVLNDSLLDHGSVDPNSQESFFMVVNSSCRVMQSGILEHVEHGSRMPIQQQSTDSLVYISSALSLRGSTFDFDLRENHTARLRGFSEPAFWWEFDSTLKPQKAGVVTGDGLPDNSDELRAAFLSKWGLAKFRVERNKGKKRSSGRYLIRGELYRQEFSPFAEQNLRNFKYTSTKAVQDSLPARSFWRNEPLLVRDVDLAEVSQFNHQYANKISVVAALTGFSPGVTVMEYRTPEDCFQRNRELKKLLPDCKGTDTGWRTMNIASNVETGAYSSHAAIMVAPDLVGTVPEERRQLKQSGVTLKIKRQGLRIATLQIPELDCGNKAAYFYIDKELRIYHTRKDRNLCGSPDLDPHIALTEEYRIVS